MSDEAFDVIVAGAGMAGATFALGAAQGGLKVAAIDPLPLADQVEESFDGRASAIAYSSFRQWRALGVERFLDGAVCPIRRILVTEGSRPGAGARPQHPAFLRFDAEEIADRAAGEPLGYMVENRWIRKAVGQALLDSSVRIFAPAGLKAVRREGGAVLAELSDGRVLRGSVIVGADGRASTVRQAAGIGVNGWAYPHWGAVATVKLERPHGGVAYEYFMPDGPLAILPLTGDRASLVWTEPPARARSLSQASPEAFEAHLIRRFGEFLGRVEVTGPRFVYPLALQLAERMSAPRMVLMGDAAHVIHPLAGQGLNLGLKDAAALAETLVEAHRLGQDIGSETVLERYARWRRFDNTVLAGGVDVFQRLFSNDQPVVRTVRNLGMAAVNSLPAARRFFMQEAGGAVGDLPRLLKGQAL
ncbi:UbiH/UbiF/VisC/COQ6 family ubiquinone biosynthesis hydroxylase [Brevundimonas sp. 2R-24]|uniref:UbiH/UbiF/VisC/COQ6 family ubiquinone biosynthesis hydroxylase n=1 Tax=Peiella sedimenti TaxID=3061083 RepID=A0ABT8SKI0_9CAUL|nr:UbiH/UbiF/VisC/COQ6 family ubiquinone biosynthesis hydroxylase [Caulobacteraceae bacterium XZ-24]